MSFKNVLSISELRSVELDQRFPNCSDVFRKSHNSSGGTEETHGKLNQSTQ